MVLDHMLMRIIHNDIITVTIEGYKENVTVILQNITAGCGEQAQFSIPKSSSAASSAVMCLLLLPQTHIMEFFVVLLQDSIIFVLYRRHSFRNRMVD